MAQLFSKRSPPDKLEDLIMNWGGRDLGNKRIRRLIQT